MIGFAAMGIFAAGLVRHVIKYRCVTSVAGKIDWSANLSRSIRTIFSHRTVKRRDWLAGLLHRAVFYGFLMAFLGTTIIFIDYDIIRPVFGVSVWKGSFYLWTSLLLDLGHLALTLALILFFWRRYVMRPLKLRYQRLYRTEEVLRPEASRWQLEDVLFLSLLLIIEITGFLQEGVRLLAEPVAWAHWSPIGLLVARGLSYFGMTADLATTIRANNWWFHGILALAFTAAIPWYKAKHILTVLLSLVMRDENALPTIKIRGQTPVT